MTDQEIENGGVATDQISKDRLFSMFARVGNQVQSSTCIDQEPTGLIYLFIMTTPAIRTMDKQFAFCGRHRESGRFFSIKIWLIHPF